MPFSALETTDEFLDMLAYWLNIRVPNIIERKTRQEIENPGMFPSDILRFKDEKKVEAVLEGPCSSLGSEEPTREFPLARCIVPEGAPDKSWIHAIVDEYTEKHGHRPASILLYANCCGSYVERQKQLIKDAFSDIEWHFPYVGDLFDNHNPDRLAQALFEAGYLEIVPAEQTASAESK